MRKSLQTIYILFALVPLAVVSATLPLSLWPQAPPICEITSPAANARLRGVVEVRGSAYLGGNFSFYKLEYSPAEAPDAWVVFATGYKEVVDGVLGSWDTTTVPDGNYNLLLTAVKGDCANYERTPPRRVVVANAEPTPTPTPTETPTPTTVPTVVIATPTVLVVQPTVVRPTPAPIPTTTRTGLPGFPEAITLPNMSVVLRYFLFGGLVAGALFIFVGVVFVVKRLF